MPREFPRILPEYLCSHSSPALGPGPRQKDDAPPPPSPNYVGTVTVTAKLLEERPKKEGETEEEAANAKNAKSLDSSDI